MQKRPYAVMIAVLLGVADAHAAVIDTFHLTAQSLSAFNGILPATDTVAAAEAIGGYRTLEIIYSSGPLGTTIAATGPVGGLLTHSQDVATSGQSRVTWDADGAGLAADLTDGGAATRFSLGIVDIDVGKIDLRLDVWDTSNNMATRTLVDIASPGPLFIPFAQFQNSAGTDFSAVDALFLTITAPASTDIAISAIRTTVVPLPASAWLFLAGLGVLATYARGRPGSRPELHERFTSCGMHGNLRMLAPTIGGSEHLTVNDAKVQRCVETLCERGCESVNRTIEALEQGRPVAGTQGLSQQERRAVLAELRAIMAVYKR